MLDTKLGQFRATSWRWWEDQSAPGPSVLPPLAGFPKKKPRRNGAEALDDEMETGCCLLRHDMTKTKRHPKWRQQNHFRRPAERPHFGQVKTLSPCGLPNGGISTVNSISSPQAEQRGFSICCLIGVMAAPCHRAPERPSVGHRTKRVNPYGAVGFLEVGPKRIRLNLGSRGGRFSRKRLKSDCVPLALCASSMIFLAMISVARSA